MAERATRYCGYVTSVSIILAAWSITSSVLQATSTAQSTFGTSIIATALVTTSETEGCKATVHSHLHLRGVSIDSVVKISSAEFSAHKMK